MTRKAVLGVAIFAAVAVILAVGISARTIADTPKSSCTMSQGSMEKACPFMSAKDAAGSMCCPKTDAKATDPVCSMSINTKDAAGKSEYKGKTYYFCSTDCKTKFDKDPGKYVK